MTQQCRNSKMKWIRSLIISLSSKSICLTLKIIFMTTFGDSKNALSILRMQQKKLIGLFQRDKTSYQKNQMLKRKHLTRNSYNSKKKCNKLKRQRIIKVLLITSPPSTNSRQPFKTAKKKFNPSIKGKKCLSNHNQAINNQNSLKIHQDHF